VKKYHHVPVFGVKSGSVKLHIERRSDVSPVRAAKTNVRRAPCLGYP